MRKKPANTLSPRIALGVALLAAFIAIVFVSLIGATNEAKHADDAAKAGSELVSATTDAQIAAVRSNNRGPGVAEAVDDSRVAASKADETLGVDAGNQIRVAAQAYNAKPNRTTNAALQGTLVSIAARQRIESARRSDELSSAITRVLALGLLGLIGSLISIAVFGVGLLRSITLPIRRLSRAAMSLGEGDFATRVPETGAADVRQLSRSLNKMAESLEKGQVELTEQHSDLATSREDADRANLAKSEFLSRMSHELRTPLNAILGFAQLLELDDLNERQRDNIGHIVSGGRHLLDLINEVLEISRIEAGSMSPSIEPVHAPTVIREAIEMVRPLGDQRGITLTAKTDNASDIWLAADQQRLKQILLNLLANAVKYNTEAGSVTVHVKATESRVQVAVTDTGMGVPQDQIPKLFIPFERLGAESSGVEGTGLGLVLALRLAEAMNGTIHVESQPWIGSTFTIDLPKAETPAAGIPVPEERPHLALAGEPVQHGESVRNVLYIEDDPANTRLMYELFSEDPRLKLITTMQGTLGIELARRHLPDLILLDIHLPDIDGPEVLKRLRADSVTRPIPVIVVSADATEEQRARLMALGAARYLTKPLQLNSVLSAVWEVLASPVTLLRTGEGRQNS